ncbi:MAG: hypothetical protein GF416_05575 [Candidatus Altiarchaeales archaeon]|nr:hypothetical protein [Candidatus Altiarchaeales archaeon]MBD3416586.1 hypothetical protein [Candidatus Altiarchaeales archaeon]
MFSHRRGQGAMEYLMTYGWAIIVVMVAGIAMWRLGIFNFGGGGHFTESGFTGAFKPLLSTCGITENALGGGSLDRGLVCIFTNTLNTKVYVQNVSVSMSPESEVPTGGATSHDLKCGYGLAETDKGKIVHYQDSSIVDCDYAPGGLYGSQVFECVDHTGDGVEDYEVPQEGTIKVGGGGIEGLDDKCLDVSSGHPGSAYIDIEYVLKIGNVQTVEHSTGIITWT